MVYSRYIIDTLGKYGNLKIIKGIGGGCDQEIIRAWTEIFTELPKGENAETKKVAVYQKVKNKLPLTV